MADFPTYRDLQEVAKREVLAHSARITREAYEREGSDVGALGAAGAATGDAVVGQLIRFSAETSLDSAKGSALDRLVFDRYNGMLRKPSSSAVGYADVSTASPAAVGFAIPIGTKFTTSDGRQFEATDQRTFPAGSSGPVQVPIQSVLTGASQQAVIGAITSISLTTAPPDVSATNLLATAGAADEEKDEDLRKRAKLFYVTSQRGTLRAIERAALDVPGVRRASARDVIESDATPARIVELVISDAFTEQLVDSTVLPGNYQAQADLLALQVRSALLDTRAAGIQVVVRIGVVQLLGVALLLRYRQGANIPAANQGARARTVAYVNDLSPGDPYVVDDLLSTLETVPGLNVLGGEVLSPATDLVAAPLQVFRTSTAQVVIGCE